ncbi:GNAT family N-acetyltransferase [Actinoplanes sp. NPDC049596]|uniref:GNAT family N-acetyltransferase n=1 Tax=unclassified Actinoplanes TaxID=2626549 RepID=UPI00342C1EE3
MAQQDTDVFVRLERFYDALPRPYARAEDFGGLVLFVREGEGWPYYARPVIGADTPSAADITAVRQRQRDLGLPEAFEWVHETTPDLLAVARSAGLGVLLAPLLTLEAAALVPDLPVDGGVIRFLDPAAPAFAAELAASRAVAQHAFSGAPAPVDHTVPPEHLSGDYTVAVVESPTEGILATGTLMRSGDVAEIAGVGTLPAARGRGYASQLTASLARRALTSGADLIFLSAGDDDVARLYTKVGFRRQGTACIAEPAAAPL